MDLDVSVLIVDDHPAVRDGIRLLLEASGLEVTGTVGTANEAVEIATALLPDVILLDITLPGADGIELADRIAAKRPGQAILFYTGCEDAAVLRRALASGTAGIASKSGYFSDLTAAILTVAAGRPYLDPRLEQLIAEA
jgi:DNA-binding NarL/FixJ family response regulator